MPVEERLRSALADQAATVRADVEGPLELVHRRRARRVAAWSVGTAAAVVMLVVGVMAVVTPEAERPAPATPPAENGDAPPAVLPTGTYARQVGVDEALTAGLPRREVRHLFHGGEEVTVVMAFLGKRDPQTDLLGWRLWFVDQDGERRPHDGGGYFHDEDGGLTVVSKWVGCLGCNYQFAWELRRGRLALDATADSQPRPTAQLLETGTWERR